MRKRFVYFISVQGRPQGPIKIGSSFDVMQRFDNLRKAAPDDLQLLGFIEGSHKDEALIHRAFCSQHLHNEWFAHSDGLMSFVHAALMQGFDAVKELLEPLAKEGWGIRVKSEEGLRRIRASRLKIEAAS